MTDERTHDDSPDDDKVKTTQATVLAELAQRHFTFHRTTDGKVYAVPLDGRNVAHFANGTPPLSDTLAHLYLKAKGRVPSAQARADAVAALKGGTYDHDPEDVALRVARPRPDRIVVDLGTHDGHAVVIRPGRWDVVERSPVTFRRSALTNPLPYPSEMAGDLGLLGGLLNVSDDDWQMIVAWLVAAVIEDVPHPILFLLAEQGCGKTFATKLLSATVDPSKAPERVAPTSGDDWAVSASGSWIVPLGNLSGIQPWLSDALCRAVTGDGFVRRALYSDDGLSVMVFRRPIVLNGIDLGNLRGDLSDRLLRITLQPLDPTSRRTEAELDEAFSEAHGRILGGLFDLVADVLEVLPDVTVTELPRLADFGRICAALDLITGWNTLGRFMGQADELAQAVVDSDPVALAIVDLIDSDGDWQGKAGELLKRLTPDRLPRDWPTTPEALSSAIRRAAPTLRRIGIGHRKGTGVSRRTHYLWRLPTETSPVEPSQLSQPSLGDGPDGPDSSEGDDLYPF